MMEPLHLMWFGAMMFCYAHDGDMICRALVDMYVVTGSCLCLRIPYLSPFHPFTSPTLALALSPLQTLPKPNATLLAPPKP